MRSMERIAAYGVLGAVLVLAGGSTIGWLPSLSTRALAAPTPEVPAAKVATCDIYLLVEKLVDTDVFTPARKAEEARISAALAPLETELGAINTELQAANPSDPSAQEKYKQFESKRNDYTARRQELSDGYSRLVSGQFVEAYERIVAEAKRIANQQGYGYVVAHKSGKITAIDPRRLVEDFLARPIPVVPEGADITEQVRMALNLPAVSPVAPATGMPASGAPSAGAPAEIKPAAK